MGGHAGPPLYMLPELLSPAGGLDAALAAFQYGADAVYLGLPRFSARADADNVTPERLRSLLAYARSSTPAKKVYVTFNTLVQDSELPQALDTLDTLDDLAPDGVIVQDLGVARLIRDHFPHLALHASTQLAAHNLDGVLALKALGFSRVVLARELTLAEITNIVRESGVEIEIFVHGALCYSYSGLCLFSSHSSGRSGNRGRCAYCCREAFNTGDRPVTPTATCYPFSMKDLALAPLLDAVAATGAHSLKIEGRMKSPLYVACVTDYYRRKLDHTLTPDAERVLIQDLQTIFSRPWTQLYAVGSDATSDTIIDPLAVGHRGAPIGRADSIVSDRDGTRWLRFTTSRALEKHDGIQVELPEGGKPFGCAVNLLRAVGSQRTQITLPAGSNVEVALPAENVPMIPRDAPVFCSASQAVRRRYPVPSLRESAFSSGHSAELCVSLADTGIGVHAEATFETPGDVSADAFLPLTLTPSRQPDQTAPAIRKAFERLGDTLWTLGTLTIDDPHGCYAPASKLNEIRRTVFDKLTEAWNLRRSARLSAITAALFAEPPSKERLPAISPAWSLKICSDAASLTADALTGIDTLILAIGHTPHAALAQQLAAWSAVFARDRIRLALPLITREADVPLLKATLRELVREGWLNWECADLAGHHMLSDLGLSPSSSDWSLYACNRVAATELASLGIGSFVLSPENSLENILSLCSARVPAASPELLAYQHTPLFMSETAPCLPQAEAGDSIQLADRRKRTFVTRKIDGIWVTVWNEAYCLADRLWDSGLNRFRIDLAWSPDAQSFPEVIRTVMEGKLPPDTHTANFGRGLA